MSSRGNRAGWMLFVVLLIANGALYGATTYLKEYNPAHWVTVSDDFGKILMAEQYPNRLEASSIAFAETSRIELVGKPGLLNPRHAEVYVDTVTGGRARVYFGSQGMVEFSNDLAKRVGQPLTITNYEKELKVRDNPLESASGAAPGVAAPQSGSAGGIPELPSTR